MIRLSSKNLVQGPCAPFRQPPLHEITAKVYPGFSRRINARIAHGASHSRIDHENARAHIHPCCAVTLTRKDILKIHVKLNIVIRNSKRNFVANLLLSSVVTRLFLLTVSFFIIKEDISAQSLRLIFSMPN